MTWFLRRLERDTRDVEPQPVPVPTVGAQFGAAFDQYTVTENARFYNARTRNAQVDDLEARLGGVAAIASDPAARELVGGQASDLSGLYGDEFVDQWRGLNTDKKLDYMLDRAGRDLARDPARYGDIPVTRDQFDEQVKQAQLAELEEAMEVLGAGDNGLVQFLGGLASAGTDEFALPMLALGPLTLGPRAGMKFIAQEMLLGAGAEIAALPRAQQQAARLELESPDAWERILTGGLFGGVVGGAFAGGARGLDYLRTRNRLEGDLRPDDMPGADFQAQVDREEQDLRAGIERPAPPARPANDTLPPAPDDAPADWPQIRNGIFAGESGGDYNALFGYSNRPGGQFANVRLTDMTVDQAIQFSDPSGPYAQWVNARVGRVATPMGAYQIVGTTLRRAAKGLGLRGDELMTPELQERLGVWIYRDQGTGAWEGYRGPQASFTPSAPGAMAPPDGGAQFDLGTSRGMTRFDEVTTPNGTRVPVEYEVVDLDSLVPARGEFQPRDRTRGASAEQVAEIAARLDARRLMPNPEADRGAPIVGPDSMIESGNGRIMAIRRAAEQHPDRYQAYVETLRAEGFDVPEGVARPVLIARRQSDFTPEQRRAFVAEANDSGTMRMAASEQAGRDADFLTSTVFDAYKSGQPIPQQGEFLRRLLAEVPQSERAAMYDRDGRLNAEGLRRVQAALFAKAYGAPDLLRRLTETPDARLRAMLDMLDQLAPDWAAFRASVEAGYIKPEFDITDDMLDVVRAITEARTEGRDGQSVIAAIRDKLAQGDLMTGQRDPAMAEALLAAFYKGDRARRPSDTGDILRRYMVDAQIVGRADSDDMFGASSPVEVLTQATRNHENRVNIPDTGADDLDASVPDTANLDPAPMQDGAQSPVLIRSADDTLAEVRAAVGGDTVDEMLAQARARLADRSAAIEALTADDGPVRLQSQDASQRALVSQSPDQPGRWRLTYLDGSGPVGHSDFDSKADALRRALEENFTPNKTKPDVARADPDPEPDLSWLATAPKTMETVRRLVDMANAAVPRGYRFKIEGNDIWLSAPDGDMRATRDLDLFISPQGTFLDLQRAIDAATENASGSDAMVRTVTLPEDVDPNAVRAMRDAMFDDPSTANMSPQEEIIEAVRRVRAAGAISETGDIDGAAPQLMTLRPGDRFGPRGRIEDVNEAPLYRDTAPARAFDVVKADTGNPAGPRSTGQLFWADDPDLAIGQDGSTGIILRARAGSLGVTRHSKPVDGEFIAYAAAPNALTEIVAVTPEAANAFRAKMTPAWRQRFDAEWQQVPKASFSRITDEAPYAVVWQRRTDQPARAAEATPAGEQTLIPGVEPISQRQRLEAQMAAPATGRDTGPASGRDDLFGNPDDRRDLFDAPARAVDGQDGPAAATPAGQGDMPAPSAPQGEFDALRDLTIRLEENGPELRVADILDDLDADQEALDIIKLCNRGSA